MAVSPIPEGYHTVTPYLVVKDAAGVIDFMVKGLGGVEKVRMDGPNGRVSHAEVQLGDSMVMLGESPDGKVMTAMLHLYVDDADATYKRALAAGATSVREMADQFYGDRAGAVRDAEGNEWHFATHVEDVSPQEMERRMEAQHAQENV